MRLIKRYWTEFIIILCCVNCFISIKYYRDAFAKYGLSENTDNWGTFGDYIGGVLGTILSFFSIILIYATYKNQVASSTLQQFETTFFNLLQNQREILKSLKGFAQTQEIDLGLYEEKEKIADEFISAVAKQLYNCFDGQTLTYIKNGKEVKNVEENKGDNQIIIDTYYNDVYKGKEAELGHYFRHLYHILKYTHESNIVTKKKYIDIVQAQMSDDELYLVFYNGISKFGKEKLQPFLEEYGFLENIRSRGKIFDLHASQFYPKTKFKYLTSQ